MRAARKIAMICITLAVVLFFRSEADAGAKYVFMFIGDGMGAAQRNAAEIYLGGARRAAGDDAPRDAQLVMNSLEQSGFITTDSLSGVTDSAAAGTALATGRKTINGAVAMDPKTGEKFTSIARMAHKMGMKVGIVTSAFLQDATPAVYYGNAPKRTDHYSLGTQLADSGFEYFGGGGFINPRGKDKKNRDLYEVAASKGYSVIKGTTDAPASGKVIAVHPRLSGGGMPWVIDRAAGPSLADFTDLGIKLLYGEDGFFMMVEGGKIDLACHANDAAASIYETIAFDEAVGRAVLFAREHPDDTLIIVTSDHETGGMTFDPNAVSGEALYAALSPRQGSYAAFERKISPKQGADIGPYLEMARSFFGPGVAKTPAVEKAFKSSMTAKKSRQSLDPQYKKLYGPYDPFTMACVKASDAAAGITWTTYYHTGKNVPVSASGGASSPDFTGEFDNTGIFE
ncbi:MAG: alkaline phosphatase, partial [Synergistaceae bacterium]|nr:alkaline phosphatase [Synergistaceae bacterium]